MKRLSLLFATSFLCCAAFTAYLDNTYSVPGTHVPAIQYGMEFNDKGSAMPKGGGPIAGSPYAHLFQKFPPDSDK